MTKQPIVCSNLSAHLLGKEWRGGGSAFYCFLAPLIGARENESGGSKNTLTPSRSSQQSPLLPMPIKLFEFPSEIPLPLSPLTTLCLKLIYSFAPNQGRCVCCFWRSSSHFSFRDCAFTPRCHTDHALISV